MLNNDKIADKMPEIMSWKEVATLWDKTTPTREDLDYILGCYEISPSVIESVLDHIQDFSETLVEQYFND